MYHISDRDVGLDDDDDEAGSKVFPSRTSWGAAYSLAEKYPFLFERRFGIKAYDYWNGYTRAQIELMTSDVPFVSYKKEKEKSHSSRAMNDLAERWAKKNAGKKSEKISLSDYMRSDVLKSK